MATKKRINTPRGALVPISKSKWNKVTRNRRCAVVSGDEGGSTWQCGKQVFVSDDVNNRYYKMVGKSALWTGYVLKTRNAGYVPKRKSSYRADGAPLVTRKKKRRR
jgi:hypothetical protein